MTDKNIALIVGATGLSGSYTGAPSQRRTAGRS